MQQKGKLEKIQSFDFYHQKIEKMLVALVAGVEVDNKLAENYTFPSSLTESMGQIKEVNEKISQFSTNQQFKVLQEDLKELKQAFLAEKDSICNNRKASVKDKDAKIENLFKATVATINFISASVGVSASKEDIKNAKKNYYETVKPLSFPEKFVLEINQLVDRISQRLNKQDKISIDEINKRPNSVAGQFFRGCKVKRSASNLVKAVEKAHTDAKKSSEEKHYISLQPKH